LSAIMASMVVRKKKRKSRSCRAAKAGFFVELAELLL